MLWSIVSFTSWTLGGLKKTKATPNTLDDDEYDVDLDEYSTDPGDIASDGH